MIGQDLLVQIEDEGAENQLLVDPTMPEEFPVWLETDRNGNLRLRPDWTELADCSGCRLSRTGSNASSREVRRMASPSSGATDSTGVARQTQTQSQPRRLK